MIVAFPHPPGKGGPGSFQARFEKALKAANWTVVYAHDHALPDVVMVVGGTKQLGWLWRMKRVGLPIVYRLDGINWLHRKVKVPFKQYVTSEIRNLLMQVIRKYLADGIIYQSQFVIDWWQRCGWRTRTPWYQIYNGVDLNEFQPQRDENTNLELLCLEGTLDYSPYAIRLLNELQAELGKEMNIVAYGGFQNAANQHKLHPSITYKGKLTRNELPRAYHNAIYLSLDVNAACPNTVIEALASSTPVVGFDTGALKELVPPSAGIIVPFGGYPWALDFPDVNALGEAIRKVRADWDSYSLGARAIAEKKYGTDLMISQYLQVINGLVKNKKNENR